MAELTYIEHLNIPVKYRGNILHAYEYNATVGKINEIIDSLHTSYEFTKNFPRFDKIDDIFASTGAGTPVMINNEYGKLYPITSSAYVLIDNTKNLDDELALLNSQITSGLTDVLNKIAQTNELINTNLEYSYARAQLLVDDLRENVNSQINDVETNVSNIHTELTNSINNTKELSYAYSYSLYSELLSDTSDKLSTINNEITQLQSVVDGNNELSYAYSYSLYSELLSDTSNKLGDIHNEINQLHDTVSDNHALSYAYSYSLYSELLSDTSDKLSTINNEITQLQSVVDGNNELSYAYSYSLYSELLSDTSNKLGDIHNEINQLHDTVSDNHVLSYAYTDTRVNELSNDTTNKLEQLREYVNQLNTELTGIVQELAAQHTIDVSNILSYIPSYVAGFGINISDENEVSVNTSAIVDNNSIYVNELGQLVVNNEVVLANAESKFKFIDENGNWVGDMANVKNYIDNSVNDVRGDLTTLIENNASDIAELRGDMNTEVTNLYTYVNKFAEYDTYGKNYKLSEEFIQSQE